jgi:protein O-GlcNAc transferase
MPDTLEIFSDRLFPEWLAQEQIGIAYSTYQTDRLTLLGVNKETGRFSGFERSFGRAMGLFAQGNRLYLGTKYQIWQFENALEPGQLHDGYDKLYIPRVGYTTGDLDVHDIVVDGNGQVVFVSTMLNCLATLSASHSCKPLWKPPFISRFINEDRCHLNGLALVDGFPRYVTACSQSDVVDGWRDRRVSGGCVIDILNNEIVVRGLSMPHSPRFYQGKLWILNSGTGELGTVDLQAGRFEPLTFCPGFLRGLAFWKNWAIVGLSKPRHGNKSFSGLPLDEMLKQKDADPRCGLMVIDLTSGAIAHWYQIEGMVTELYDVLVLPGVQRPMLLGFQTQEIAQLISIEPVDTLNQPVTHPPEVLLSSSLEASAQEYIDRSRILKQQGKFPEAESCLREAVHLKPDFWGAWNNLGTLLQNQNRWEEARECYENAILHNRNFAEAIANRASLWQMDGELERAKTAYLQAIQLKSECVPAHFNLATIYKQQGRLAAAVQHFQEVVNRQPDYHEAHFALAQILEYQDRYEEAEYYYRQAEQFSPTPSQISLVRAHLRLRFCDWQDYDLHTQRLIDLVSDPVQRQQYGLSPLALSTFPIPLQLHREMAEVQSRSIVQQATALQEKQPALRFSHPRLSRPKLLRIGYLSPDFREHAVGRLICQLFQHHDRDRFEIFAYSAVDVNDEITQQVRLGCDRYVDLSPLSTVDAARRIHADGIDILIDLAGYTIGNLAAVLALQPAPIQISWLGYPDTMGAPFMQYILADRWLIPPDHKQYFTEEVIYLPQAFVASPLPIQDHPFKRTELGLPAQGFIYCCFNSHYKINPLVFDVWMGILLQVPKSILWLTDGAEKAKQNLRQAAQERGVDPKRLIFASKKSHADYLAQFQLANLFLDTFTYNAGSTAAAAISAGLPLLTKLGEPYAARMGASICASVGLESFICQSVEEYERQAIAFGNKPSLLKPIRSKLQTDKEMLPLFNLVQFVQNLESVYMDCWEKSSESVKS